MKTSSSKLQEIILNSDEYFQSLLADIALAQSTIDLETYIYADDELGAKIADAICKATARKVKCRILVDGVGTPFFHKSLQKMEAAGAIVKIFHPIPFNFMQYGRSNYQSSFISKILTLFARINIRNHRKTCLIDKKIAYVGSANIDQRHLSMKPGQGWRDTIIKLINADVTDLQFAFDIAWRGFPIDLKIRKRFQQVNVNPRFRLNYSRHLRLKLYKSLLKKIAGAKSHILVTSAYFIPNYFILKKLSQAARRGINVKILLPQESDLPLIKIVSATFYENLIKSGVLIYEYIPNILHAKIMNVDDWYVVGSSNLNHRSLRHDLEVDVDVETQEAKTELAKQFNENINNSKRINLTSIRKLPLYKKILGYIFLFGKYYF